MKSVWWIPITDPIPYVETHKYSTAQSDIIPSFKCHDNDDVNDDDIDEYLLLL